jgi:hypothetical protein
MVVVLRPPLLFPRKNSLGGFISSLCWGGSKEVCLSSCPKGNSSQSCRYIWYLLWPTAPGRPWNERY